MRCLRSSFLLAISASLSSFEIGAEDGAIFGRDLLDIAGLVECARPGDGLANARFKGVLLEGLSDICLITGLCNAVLSDE